MRIYVFKNLMVTAVTDGNELVALMEAVYREPEEEVAAEEEAEVAPAVAEAVEAEAAAEAAEA